MLLDLLIDVIFNSLTFILSKLPFMSFSINTGAMPVFLNVLSSVLYFLPWNTIFPILTIVLMLQGIRIGIAIIRTIFGFFLG